MIASIRLQQYRSYRDESFEFNKGVNIIVGPNASGKTNLLEALLMITRGSSYRAHDAELVMFNQPWSRLDALTQHGSRTVKIVTDPALLKTFEIDGRVFKRFSMHHMIPTVLFEPNHLVLLNGSPDRRREYLDDVLIQTVPGYGVAVRAYRRALAQRNRLLKEFATPREHFFPWNIRLSQYAAVIVRARVNLIDALQAQLGGLYRDLADADTAVSVRYGSQAPPEHYESQMIRRLEVRLDDDLQRGYTTFGPHREDLEVLFNGRTAAEVASRGETRTLVLALKILELQLLERARDQRPLLLLDDVFSELDGSRRKALTAHLRDYQTFMTTTDADVAAQHFSGHSTILALGQP